VADGAANRNQAPDRRQLSQHLMADTLRHLEKSLKKQWKRYRKRLKRCQKEFSEKAVHDSRVQTRRLLSTVELSGAFLPQSRLHSARRALKRHLDTFKELRDTQVQLVYVGKMLLSFPGARPFHGYLLKHEERCARQARDRIKRLKAKRIEKIIAGYRAELRERRKLLLRALDRAFTGVQRLRRRVNPNNTATIHRTRVAFKRFRYMVEALATMLPEATKKRRADMQHYQALMGNIQDMEVLLATLRKFFKKNEIKQESARRFHEELLRRRQWFVQTYLDAADQLNDFWP
jgi:CHAD domain-containing protein